MSKRKNVLGRGLSSILGNKNIANNYTDKKPSPKLLTSINNIHISSIITNPFQPRKRFDKQELKELAISIKQLGIIQPITVRKLENEKYQLITGERRLKSSKLLNLKKIPAFIRFANDQQMLEMALVENIQRSALNPIEIALSYKRLIEECNITQEECSKRVGKERSTIANFIRLLRLPEEIQSALKKKIITTGHARSLINIENQENQINIFHDIVEHGFSVREVEQIVKFFGGKKYKKKKKIMITTPLSFNNQKIINELDAYFKKNVKLIQNKKKSGKIIIPFSSTQDLNDIVKKICN